MSLDKKARLEAERLARAEEPPMLEPLFPFTALPFDAAFFGAGYVPQKLPPGAQIQDIEQTGKLPVREKNTK